jgi:hypothetical protein
MFLIIAVVFSMLTQLIEFGMSGPYLSDGDDFSDVQTHLQGYRFLASSPEDQAQLYKEGHTWITYATYPILVKYKIKGVGLVPRWTKMATMMDSYYDSLKRNDTRLSADKWMR